MASSWITTYTTKADGKHKGAKRYRVLYRLGGRESKPAYAGSFATQRDALARKKWVAGEIANLRVPDVAALTAEPVKAPTLREAADKWRSEQNSVSEGTSVLHRVALARVLPTLGTHRVDGITVADVKALVAELAGKGKKRETIRKSVKYLAAVLEDQGIDPNPARDKSIARALPREEPVELEPPTATHVEAVCSFLPSAYRLPLLWLDWSGARVASIDNVLVGDYDEIERRVRLRAATTKTRRALWVELHPTLADAIEATLPPREDRNLDAPLFPGCNSDALRTAIGRACKAVGIPVFSPHDLRHRRISVLHKQGRTWAEIGRLVGQQKLSITADTYTHVLIDAREVDYTGLLKII
jgi:integrase